MRKTYSTFLIFPERKIIEIVDMPTLAGLLVLFSTILPRPFNNALSRRTQLEVQVWSPVLLGKINRVALLSKVNSTKKASVWIIGFIINIGM